MHQLIGTESIQLEKQMQLVRLLANSLCLLLLVALLLPPGTSSWLPRYFQSSFIVSLIILMGMSLLVVYLWITTSKIIFTDVDIALCCFGLYTFVRYLTTPESHWSQGSTIWFLTLVLAYVSFRNILPLLHIKLFWGLLMTIVIIQVSWGLLQLYDKLPSQHSVFKITGSFFNSAPYSGFLAIMFPLALDKILSREAQVWEKKVAWIVCAGILLVVLPARSRAAWLALTAGASFLLIQRYDLISAMAKLKLIIRLGLVALILAIGTSAIWGVYSLKPDSADGRVLIWKISCHIFRDSPAFGSGFARFAPKYMLAQADYFESGKGTDKEDLLAGQVTFAYNEFLQVAVELGLVGLILLGIIFLLALISKENTLPEHSGVSHWKAALVTWIVFACFSYPMSSWPICLLLVLSLARLAGYRQVHIGTNRKWLLMSIFTILVCVGALWGVNTWPSLAIWKEARTAYQHTHYTKANALYGSVFNSLAYEGAFLQQLAKSQQQAGHYAASNSTLAWSKRYYNDPFTYSMLGENYTHLKIYDQAEAALNNSCHMIPHRLWPRYLLVQMLWEKGDKERCAKLAQELLSTEVKKESLAVTEIKQDLQRYAASGGR